MMPPDDCAFSWPSIDSPEAARCIVFRSHRSYLLLPFALIIACTDGGGPLAADRTTAEFLPVQSDAVESGTGVLEFEGTLALACLDEEVHEVLNAPYNFRLVTTPSGNTVYLEPFDHKLVTGTMTGLSSGTIWHRTTTVSPFVSRSTGGNGGMTHYTSMAKWVSETGPSIHATQVFHLSFDASGRLTAEHSSFSCWTK